MALLKLDETTWGKILAFLRQQPGIYIGQEANCRRFVEAMLWMAPSGAQWRLLPTGYGDWNTIYKRFNRWSQRGIWHKLHQHLIDIPDLENLLIDTTLIRAHPCAAGAKGGNLNRLWGEVEVVSLPKSML